MQFGMVQQPWFIGTVIGTVGGALWFALCVFSLWLCRRRQRRHKYPRSNGVVSGDLFIHLFITHGLSDYLRDQALKPDILVRQNILSTVEIFVTKRYINLLLLTYILTYHCGRG